MNKECAGCNKDPSQKNKPLERCDYCMIAQNVGDDVRFTQCILDVFYEKIRHEYFIATEYLNYIRQENTFLGATVFYPSKATEVSD